MRCIIEGGLDGLKQMAIEIRFWYFLWSSLRIKLSQGSLSDQNKIIVKDEEIVILIINTLRGCGD